MTPKKTNRTNLEKKRLVFFEYGVVLTLAFLLVAFEWGTKNLPDIDYSQVLNSATDETDLAPITRPEVQKPPAPVKPLDFIVIKDDEPEIDDMPIDLTSEIGINEGLNLTYWEPEKNVDEPKIFILVQKMPTYKGGTEADFQKDLQKLVQYPVEAQRMGIQGKVVVNFVVDETGKLVNPKILQSADGMLSNAVLDALKKTSRWKPGEQRGRKVKVSFNIPVFFRLN